MRRTISVITLLALIFVSELAQGAPKIVTKMAPSVTTQQQQNPPNIISINITSPVGGEQWAKLQGHPVTWTHKGNPGTSVNILLMQGATLVKTLASGQPIAAALFNWQPDNSITTGANYTIMVQSVEHPTVRGQSKAFSIVVGVLSSTATHGPVSASAYVLERVKIIKPLQGANWAAGDPQDITWEYSGDPPGQSRVLLMNGSQTVKTISTGQSWGQGGKGYIMPYSMPTDVTPGNGYFIKIVSTINDKYLGTGGQFTIQPYVRLIVTQPPNNAALANWPVGSVHPIAWTYTGDCGSHVKVALHGGVNDQWKIYPLVTSWSIGANGTGNFTWVVPTESASGIHWISGNTYQLMVSGVENQKCWDWTGQFTVSP